MNVHRAASIDVSTGGEDAQEVKIPSKTDRHPIKEKRNHQHIALWRCTPQNGFVVLELVFTATGADAGGCNSCGG